MNEKRVILEEFPINNVGVMQAFAFNLRRNKFKDPRVRLAFNYAFDFEEMNKQFFFGQYKRINSYFEGTELACSGLPQGEELKILEPLRDKVPPEVFTTPYANPVAGTSENVRANLREGMRLMAAAGYELRDHKQVHVRTGELHDVVGITTRGDIADDFDETIQRFHPCSSVSQAAEEFPHSRRPGHFQRNAIPAIASDASWL